MEYEQEKNLKSLKEFASKFLKTFKKRITKDLYDILNEHSEADCAQFVISSTGVFSHSLAYAWKQDVKGQTYLTVLASLKGSGILTDIQTRNINASYEVYLKTYNEKIELYNTCPSESTINSILACIIAKADTLKGRYLDKRFYGLAEREELIAMIFALWTILKAKNDDNQDIEYLYEPHSVQIIAIFLLLGIEDKTLNSQL